MAEQGYGQSGGGRSIKEALSLNLLEQRSKTISKMQGTQVREVGLAGAETVAVQ